MVAEVRCTDNSPNEKATIAVVSVGLSRRQGYKLFRPDAAKSALSPGIVRQRLALVG
ncbi:Uncharacterised protein [Brucella anthropi]|nr:Uncharacterised protein [Brucella anthropi]